ncbi:tetratricopeptide repeat protein [Actinoplanes sp. Pm04-4]|uniref:Tetratricopeptide repeat protein n=1 Tax=Paractinoplanes pyxinae TaxID=2997416 RepID=A0ABT4BAR7_9ACTN|nr:tetratricopeptide repeat protein [Actinoplanes pyxinae]MCY1143582.1 tetratricopeptide repeat protein [Actinoplanes pyxinae]
MDLGDLPFGQRLRHYREQAGLTQLELAERAGISLAGLRDLEQGRSRSPRPSSMRALSAALGLAPSALTVPAAPAPAPRPVPEGEAAVLVLGPLETFVGTERVDLGSGRHSTVLVRLALTPNVAVHRDELIDLLWGHDVPPSAVNLIQTYVSRLRRALEPRRTARGESRLLSLVREAYRLNVDDAQVDLLRMRRLAARAEATADPEPALALLDEALTLWRGGPDTPELRDTPLVTRLGDEHLQLVLRHADLARRTGRPEAALPRLREQAGRHRLHEPLQARLIVTLAASGRQAEALAVYDDVRQELADELGIDPGPDLLEAHRGVLQRRWLRAVPVAAPSRATPVFQAPAPPADFTGRAEHLHQVIDLLGTGAVCTISGVAGVGKTALALQAAQRLRADFPDGQLYIDLQGAGPQPLPPVDALARFLRALGVEGRRIPTEPAEQSALFRSTLADRRMLIVLDNAREAAQVLPLLPGVGGCAVLVTSRRTLADLPGAKLVGLAGFTEGEALDLLAHAAGEARIAGEPEAAHELAKLCGLLPLALRVAGGRLAAGSAWTVRSLVDRLGDEKSRLRELHVGDTLVSAGFELSYADLPPAAARAFRLLSLAPGPDFTVEAATAVLGADAYAVIGHLVDANLLQTSQADRFRFHDLLRLFAAQHCEDQDPFPVRGEALNRLREHYLDRVAAALVLVYPAMVRLPHEPAITFDSADSALAWLDAELDGIVATVRLGGEYAWRIADQLRGYFFVRRTAVPWLETAEAGLAAADESGDDRARAAMHQTLGQANWSTGRHQEALRHYRTGQTLAEQAGWLEAAAYLRHNIGLVQAELGHVTDAQESFEQALEVSSRHGFAHVEAVTLNDLGAMCSDQGRLTEAADYFGRALTINSAQGRQQSELSNRNNLGMVLRQLGDHDGALEHLTIALNAYRARGEPHGELAVLDELSQAYDHRGDHRAAVRAAREGLDLTRHIGDRRAEAALLTTTGEALLGAGSPTEALHHFDDSHALATELSYPYFRTRSAIGVARARLALGDTDGWRTPAQVALTGARSGGYRLLEAGALLTLALGALAAGHPSEAEPLAQQALAISRAAGSPLQEEEIHRLLERV